MEINDIVLARQSENRKTTKKNGRCYLVRWKFGKSSQVLVIENRMYVL